MGTNRKLCLFACGGLGRVRERTPHVGDGFRHHNPYFAGDASALMTAHTGHADLSRHPIARSRIQPTHFRGRACRPGVLIVNALVEATEV
jgi:hypothetical protein